MKLTEKGKIVPPIKLGEPMETVSKTVQSWNGIISATHWNLYNRTKPDGADFYVSEEELGHIHLNGEVHLATSTDLKNSLVKRHLARPFVYAKEWVEYSIKTEADARHALWLFNLNYQRLMGQRLDLLLQEIESYRVFN